MVNKYYLFLTILHNSYDQLSLPFFAIASATDLGGASDFDGSERLG
jgi:hypothetical protein